MIQSSEQEFVQRILSHSASLFVFFWKIPSMIACSLSCSKGFRDHNFSHETQVFWTSNKGFWETKPGHFHRDRRFDPREFFRLKTTVIISGIFFKLLKPTVT